MDRPYLVQRLKGSGRTTPFDFGGGYLNGGINKDAMKEISQVFTFDYMGAAEFEWGAVPTALQKILDRKDMISYELDTKQGKIYVIAPSEIKEDLNEWLKSYAKKEQWGETKESVRLDRSLQQLKDGEEPRIKGWLKIEDDRYCEEPFMFFVDENMFNGTKKLFNIKN